MQCLLTCIPAHTDTNSITSHSLSRTLILHKRLVSIWLLPKITVLYLQAIDLCSSVPPQDLHCFCSLYCSQANSSESDPVDTVTFQEQFHICAVFSKMCVTLQRWLCKSKSLEHRRLEKTDASRSYYRLGKAGVELRRVIEAVQIKQRRTFILSAIPPAPL